VHRFEAGGNFQQQVKRRLIYLLLTDKHYQLIVPAPQYKHYQRWEKHWEETRGGGRKEVERLKDSLHPDNADNTKTRIRRQRSATVDGTTRRPIRAAKQNANANIQRIDDSIDSNADEDEYEDANVSNKRSRGRRSNTPKSFERARSAPKRLRQSKRHSDSDGDYVDNNDDDNDDAIVSAFDDCNTVKGLKVSFRPPIPDVRQFNPQVHLLRAFADGVIPDDYVYADGCGPDDIKSWRWLKSNIFPRSWVDDNMIIAWNDQSSMMTKQSKLMVSMHKKIVQSYFTYRTNVRLLSGDSSTNWAHRDAEIDDELRRLEQHHAALQQVAKQHSYNRDSIRAMLRMFRALDEHSRMCLVHSFEDASGRQFEVRSSKGDTSYFICFNDQHRPTCTCPDHARTTQNCKHILFVLLRVVKLDRTLAADLELLISPRFSGTQMKKLSARIPVLHNGSSSDVQSMPSQASSSLLSAIHCVLAQRKQVSADDECAVCYEPMDTNNEEHDPIVWCKKQCGNNLHSACFDQWANSAISRNDPVTCPYCRAEWLDDVVKPSTHVIEVDNN